MQFILDVHCHTINSGHAYSTISENAAHAAEIGLTHIGISDHGPAMSGGADLNHFRNLWILPDYIHGVRILKGAECNILNANGKLDIPGSLLEKMDFVIASLHGGVMSPSDNMTHTQAIISAMENNPSMHILGHPCDVCFEIDIEAVVSSAAKTNIIIEINNNSLKPGFLRYQGDGIFIDLLNLCKRYKVPVLASSDAHFHTLVGSFDHAKAVIEAVDMPESLVLNTCAERFQAAIARRRSS
ncbi:MAG: PHP domain-containing protein [Defluviitaleaceae bacterium]|nr:PHP domain-containing protein [Defluviitaleaceae bacterium]